MQNIKSSMGNKGIIKKLETKVIVIVSLAGYIYFTTLVYENGSTFSIGNLGNAMLVTFGFSIAIFYLGIQKGQSDE